MSQFETVAEPVNRHTSAGLGSLSSLEDTGAYALVSAGTKGLRSCGGSTKRSNPAARCHPPPWTDHLGAHMTAAAGTACGCPSDCTRWIAAKQLHALWFDRLCTSGETGAVRCGSEPGERGGAHCGAVELAREEVAGRVQPQRRMRQRPCTAQPQRRIPERTSHQTLSKSLTGYLRSRCHAAVPGASTGSSRSVATTQPTACSRHSDARPRATHAMRHVHTLWWDSRRRCLRLWARHGSGGRPPMTGPPRLLQAAGCIMGSVNGSHDDGASTT